MSPSRPKPEQAFYVTIGHHLLQARRSANVSQSQVGDALGVSFQMVQKYEKGSVRIPVDKLVTFCRLIDANVADVLQLDARQGKTRRELELEYEVKNLWRQLKLIREALNPKEKT